MANEKTIHNYIVKGYIITPDFGAVIRDDLPVFLSRPNSPTKGYLVKEILCIKIDKRVVQIVGPICNTKGETEKDLLSAKAKAQLKSAGFTPSQLSVLGYT